MSASQNGRCRPDRRDRPEPRDDDPIHLGGNPELGGDELNRLADGPDTLHLLFRDGHPKLLFQSENRLHEVERVGVEILLEARRGGDLLHRDRQVVGRILQTFCSSSAISMMSFPLPCRAHAPVETKNLTFQA